MRSCVAAVTGDWSAFVKQSSSFEDVSAFLSNAMLNNIPIASLQKINPHEICVQLHAVAARMQLQWMGGYVTDVGFMRVTQLMLSFAQGILDVYKHFIPFVAAWRRVCSTAEAIVQHTAHVLLMTTGYREQVGGDGTAAASAAAAGQFHRNIPRGHFHFAFKCVISNQFTTISLLSTPLLFCRRFMLPEAHDTLYGCSRICASAGCTPDNSIVRIRSVHSVRSGRLVSELYCVVCVDAAHTAGTSEFVLCTSSSALSVIRTSKNSH
jgi:hypothetical protein